MPERLHSLDTLRGVAALAVVFWHWQHFFYTGTSPGNVTWSNLPLSDVFFLFYTEGIYAVFLFFSLSGFVFYWLYSRAVADRTITARDFAVLRFSRLYPLHLVTLLVVAIGQIWFVRTTGSYFVYPVNDLWHFVLNLLFASSWGLEQGYSFNAPNWSVSVEIVFYALFFLFCRLLPIRDTFLFMLAIGGLLLSRVYAPIFLGGSMFFLGGLAYLVYQRIIASGNAVRVGRWLVAVCAVAWIATIVIGWLEAHGTPVLQPAAESLARMHPALRRIGLIVIGIWPSFLFPVTILTLALVETTHGNFTGRLSILGDISYSSYMLHFPLQLITIALVIQFGIDRTIFLSVWTLALFFIVLIVMSYASYRFLEVPAQRALRKGALAKHASARVEAIP